MMIRVLPAVLLAVFAALPVAAPAAAQTNLARNAGFDAGLGPWGSQGAVTWAPSGGQTSPGAASCTDADSCQIFQCVDLGALSHPQTFTSEIALSHAGSTATITRFAFVYPNRTCSGIGQGVDFTETFFPFTTWTTYSSTFDSLADTRSVRIEYSIGAAFGGPPMNALLDDASLEASFGPIFLDGYESGDTSEWSSTIP